MLTNRIRPPADRVPRITARTPRGEAALDAVIAYLRTLPPAPPELVAAMLQCDPQVIEEHERRVA